MTVIIILIGLFGVFGSGFMTAGILKANTREESYIEGFHDGYHKALNDLKDISKECDKYEVL